MFERVGERDRETESYNSLFSSFTVRLYVFYLPETQKIMIARELNILLIYYKQYLIFAPWTQYVRLFFFNLVNTQTLIPQWLSATKGRKYISFQDESTMRGRSLYPASLPLLLKKKKMSKRENLLASLQTENQRLSQHSVEICWPDSSF